MKAGIIDYSAGNTFSVTACFERLDIPVVLSNKSEVLSNCDLILLPGVGHAKTAMQSLEDLNLVRFLKSLTQPVLGICIGLQIMCNYSEEGNTDCLGIFDAEVKRFNSNDLTVPHMGWNKVEFQETNFQNDNFYYVHSYYVPLCEHTIARTTYGLDFSAILRKDNFFATQFHPEKSGLEGESFIREFLKYAL